MTAADSRPELQAAITTALVTTDDDNVATVLIERWIRQDARHLDRQAARIVTDAATLSVAWLERYARRSMAGLAEAAGEYDLPSVAIAAGMPRYQRYQALIDAGLLLEEETYTALATLA